MHYYHNNYTKYFILNKFADCFLYTPILGLKVFVRHRPCPWGKAEGSACCYLSIIEAFINNFRKKIRNTKVQVRYNFFTSTNMLCIILFLKQTDLKVLYKRVYLVLRFEKVKILLYNCRMDENFVKSLFIATCLCVCNFDVTTHSCRLSSQ